MFTAPKSLYQVEFYITNHCNITCDNCNRFNNQKITGSEDWLENRETYREWSRVLDIKKIAILGGEPLMHPRLPTIIDDIREFWPNAEIELTTNGILLKKIKSETKRAIIDNNVYLYVSIHSNHWIDSIKKFVEDSFGKLKQTRHYRIKPNNPAGWDEFVSDSGNKIKLEYTSYFRKNSLKINNNRFSLHNSDPEAAHKNCDTKRIPHFWQGKMYKCGVSVTLPYLIEQRRNQFDITDNDIELANSYQPVQHTDANLYNKIASMQDNCIAQCKFCPENYGERQPTFPNKLPWYDK